MLEHSPACIDITVMSKNPIIPLHPELRAYALLLLRDQLVPMGRVRILCRDWAQKKWGNLSGDPHYRYLLTSYESTSLYRTLSRESGIPARSGAAENLDRWFRAEHPCPPDPELTKSLMYYRPLGTGPKDRFILILSTPKQQEMAWEIGHKQQVLLDLTFGVCSAKILVGIAMGINKNGRGIPLAMFIFSPLKDAKAAHASYDGAILKDILTEWKKSMGKNKAGEEYEILVANTDNDTRERFALVQVWCNVFLLLCMFHSWQAWRNGLTRCLKPIPKGPPRQEVRKRLAKFLMSLLKDITEYSEALEAYNQELVFFRSLGTARNSDLNRKKSKGGLAFLAYFKSYLDVRSFWLSWSKAGVIEAARRLGIPVNKVPRTTNHLESWNGHLKKKWYMAYHRSGRLPRIDTWVLITITKVMPEFFKEVAEEERRADYFFSMRYAAPNKQSVTIDHHANSEPLITTSPTITQLSDEIEADMLQEIYDDGVHEEDEDDADSAKDLDQDVDGAEASEDLGHYQFSLRIDPDGDTSSFSIDSEDSIASLSPLPLWDNALDTSAIILDLPDNANHSIPFPYTSGQPSSESDDPGAIQNILGLELLSMKAPNAPEDIQMATRHSNEEATTWQEILAAEDHLTDLISTLRMQSTDPDVDQIISPHVSPTIACRLLNWAPTEEDSFMHTHGNSTPPPSFSAATASLSLPPIDYELTSANQLPDFEIQRKARRHESYGIR